MAAPATRESKPGSAVRDAGDGQVRNARRVTGPLAGAVLGPTVCGGCERGRWRRTTPTTGLFQRYRGWYGPGGGVFAAEEGLKEGVDPIVQSVPPGGEGCDIGARVLAELDQVRTEVARSRPRQPRGDVRGCRTLSSHQRPATSRPAGSKSGVLEYAGSRETRFQGPFRASFRPGSKRKSPRRPFENTEACWRERSRSLRRSARGTKGDLQAEWPAGSTEQKNRAAGRTRRPPSYGSSSSCSAVSSPCSSSTMREWA